MARNFGPMTTGEEMTQTDPQPSDRSKGVDTDMLYDVIPAGRENAETSIQIWIRFGLWAPTTIRERLNRLAAEGRIERLTLSARKAGEAYRYYRKI